MREEAGTPDIVGSIRAGLVFQLKNAVGTKLIEEREGQLARKALDAWQDVSGLYVLGEKWKLNQIIVQVTDPFYVLKRFCLDILQVQRTRIACPFSR